MLFAGWEVRIVKNCDRGLENAARGRPRSLFFTLRTDPYFFFFQALQRKKTHVSVTVTVVRDRKIRTALRTNQIVGFVTAPARRKLKTCSAFSQIEMHRSYPDVDFLFVSKN